MGYSFTGNSIPNFLFCCQGPYFSHTSDSLSFPSVIRSLSAFRPPDLQHSGPLYHFYSCLYNHRNVPVSYLSPLQKDTYTLQCPPKLVSSTVPNTNSLIDLQTDDTPFTRLPMLTSNNVSRSVLCYHRIRSFLHVSIIFHLHVSGKKLPLGDSVKGHNGTLFY